MRKSIMLFTSLFLAIFYANIAFAGPITDVINEYNNKKDNRTVVVLFHTEGNVDIAAANIINLMKTRDPGGFMNPYWIVNIPNKATNNNNKCGIVAGTWYQAGFPQRGNWESIMEGSQRYTDLYTILYTLDSGLMTITSLDSNAETLNKICTD